MRSKMYIFYYAPPQFCWVGFIVTLLCVCEQNILKIISSVNFIDGRSLKYQKA